MVNKPKWTWEDDPDMYARPSLPVHNNNPQWSTHHLYLKVVLENEWHAGKNLVFQYFNHSFPLALWLPDGEVVPADSKKEFAGLICFTRENHKYLPGWENTPPFPFKKLVSIPEFHQIIQDKINAYNAEYARWKAEEERMLVYINNVREYRRAMEQPVPELPQNWQALDSLPLEFIISDKELNSETNNRIAAIYLAPLKQQAGNSNRYSSREINKNLIQYSSIIFSSG
ncbi:MAG: hypothetical protein NTZ34_05385 [Chloroflexi bacterium]|nr:hypothetical protein [Chloroflexota bacterium]